MSTPKLYGRDRVTLRAVLSRLRELGFQPTVESARGGGSHMKVRWGPPPRMVVVTRYTGNWRHTAHALATLERILRT